MRCIFRDARGRLAYVLDDLIDRRSDLSSNTAVKSKNKTGLIQLSHQQLADLAGLTRPTTTKLRNEFAEDGFLDLHRKKIVVRSRFKVQALIDFSG